jgi:uncharacterized protein (TIGR03067 family)
MKWRALALVAAMVAVAADNKEEAAKKDLDHLQGAWQMQSGIQAGVEAQAEAVAKVKMTFKGNKVTLGGGPQTQEATITLDASKMPATIDMTLDKPDRTLQGIYQLEGDTMKLCLGRPGTARPKEFASKEGSEATLMIFKREKK